MLYVLIDIGSTFTKGTLVDTESHEVLGHGLAITTVRSGILKGCNEMLEKLKEDCVAHDHALTIHEDGKFWDRALLCSSAAGGLKMVSVGLGRRLTAEAATRSALGAGARILKTYSYELTDAHIAEIDEIQPDIILLSGGTDGGNATNLVYNASMLAKLHHRMPVVIAGNADVASNAAEALRHFDVTIPENVMPQVNVLNAEPARAAIRDIFMAHITHAKGLDDVVREIGPVLMPTPDAALHAARLLAYGTENEEGWGELLLADIGGATTDIHSFGAGRREDKDHIMVNGKRCELRYEGLQEPVNKRTVEGDLGMRYSAESLFESVGQEELNATYPADYAAETHARAEEIRFIPQTEHDRMVDTAMARACVQHALARHNGILRREFENGRYIYYLGGKDLSAFHVLIGTGGVIVHNEHPEKILNPDDRLLFPHQPDLYLDADYIISACGLLSTEDPDAALQILKRTLKRVN